MLNSGCWSSIDDVHGFNGVPNKVDNLEDCKRICVNTNSCVAIDWDQYNVLGDNCWILKKAGFGPTLKKGTITHHLLNRRCTS